MSLNKATSAKTVSPIKIIRNKIVNNKNNNLTNDNKRSLSSSFSPPQSQKKIKLFVTPNRFSLLSTEEPNVEDLALTDLSQGQLDTANNAPENILPPSVFIKGILDFIGLRDNLINIIGTNTFSCKATSITQLKFKQTPRTTTGR